MAHDDTPTLPFGNSEVRLPDLLRLTEIAGPVGEEDEHPDEFYLRFEKQTYTRAEVMELAQIIARMRPDECDVSNGDLRLWWD
jgi:hypothetical protein